jgi:DNA repair exonuclease SbcCD ATPase subunit
MDAKELRQKVSFITSNRDFEEKNLTRLRGKVTKLEEDKLALVKVQALIDKGISVISANGIGKIESIVTGGLRAVFQNPDYRLVVEKKEGAKGNTYKLRIGKGELVGDALGTFGGGVSAVAAFLMRIIMIKRFKLAKFVVVDESFNNVSPQIQPKVSEMLQKLVHDHGFTIFMVTHQSGLVGAADHVYEAIPSIDSPPILRKLSNDEILEIATNGLTDTTEANAPLGGGNTSSAPGSDSSTP